jgi:hypothetical protein
MRGICGSNCLRRSIVLATLVLACAQAPTRVEDQERGCAYVVPRGWSVFDNEMRSPDFTLFEVRVYELEGAAADFLAGLPDSVVPQLEAWAREYYVVDGPPTRASVTVGGESAVELRYPVRVRAGAAAGSLAYWLVRHGSRLYVLRAAFAPGVPEEDEAAVASILESWQFLDRGSS